MDSSTRDPRRRRAEHLGPQRRRPQILDAALAIMAERGVSAVTIGAIAERLDVTRPVIYSCFAGRVEVIAALLQRETEWFADALVDSLNSAHGDTPEAAFITGFQSLLGTVQDNPYSWRLVFFTAPDHRVASRFTRVRAQLCDAVSVRLRPVLTTWWSMSDAAADDALPVLVEHVVSSCEGAVRSLLDSVNTWPSQSLGELYGRMECHAVRAATQPRPTSSSPVVRTNANQPWSRNR